MTKTKMISGVLAFLIGLATPGLVALGQDAGAAEGAGQREGQRGERRWHRGGKRGGHDMRGGLGRFARNLNLSDAQKQQMQQIAGRYRQANESLREQFRAQHKDEFGSFGDGTFNEAAIRSAAQARANLQVEMAVSRARMMSEMYAVLTPEQKTQLAQQREQWKQKMNERRARRGANSDNRQ
ncbi:MAG TPA: Spy/CpxP family protein refolding chaperone [Pyrinomonadaceae bacterium]|jgi:Spy/CpxP family protein refolding chaperone